MYCARVRLCFVDCLPFRCSQLRGHENELSQNFRRAVVRSCLSRAESPEFYRLLESRAWNAGNLGNDMFEVGAV